MRETKPSRDCGIIGPFDQGRAAVACPPFRIHILVQSDMRAPDPISPQDVDWPAIAGRWQTLAGEWAQWWHRVAFGGATTGTASVPSMAAGPAAFGLPWSGVRAFPPPTSLATPAPPVDWRELVDRYEMQLRALWRQLLPDGGELPPLPADAIADDKRFAATDWDIHPYFALLKHSYLLTAHFARAWAERAELDPASKRRIAFLVRQYLDAIAPSNYAGTNPEALKLAMETRGESLRHGMENLAADSRKGRISMTDDSAFAVGRNIAITPGAVVHRNALIELLQYAPTTREVHARPLVMIPPCINKYYILDLQPDNSFVRHAVDAGHTVFMVSWRNVPPELGRTGWDDYLEQGVLEALRVARQITGSKTVNALGFCVGGTLLASALAVLAARGERSVVSATFMTTMLDFAEPGEIGVYVSEELLRAREAGLLSGERIHGGELATAFASLRANDLVWNYVVNNYLKGRTPPAFDLLYWNSDSANLPGPMYVYYLRNMYIENRLRQRDALTMLGEKIDLGKVDVPAYVLAAREDHIVPWPSAYASARLLGGEVEFVLGASGHIAGAINPASRNRRNYWTGGDPHATADAEAWLAGAQSHPGSWWTNWAQWLERHAGPTAAAPKKPGSARHRPVAPAPGTYVLEPSTPAPDRLK